MIHSSNFDDTKITENTHDLLKEVYQQMNELNEEWDIIYVGGQWTPHYGIYSNSYMVVHKIDDKYINTMFIKQTKNLLISFE